MFTTFQRYIHLALQKAQYKHDNVLNVWVGNIPELPGAIAQSDTIETTRNQLAEVVEDWVLVSLQFGDNIPSIDGVGIRRIKPHANQKLAHA